jgi:uncharacterized protein (DUF983 family)
MVNMAAEYTAAGERHDRRRLIWTAIRRGWSKRCPNCGNGPLFVRWTTVRRQCSACGLLFERDAGDSWGFLIVTDRIPLLIAIVAIVFFGVRVTSTAAGILFFAVTGGPILLTMPRRQGVGIALAYLSRVIWPDPNDSLPSFRP